MRLIISFIAAVICAVSAYAATPDDKTTNVNSYATEDMSVPKKSIRFGLTADLGLTNVVGEGDKPGFGVQIGALADLMIRPKVFLESGLMLTSIAHREEGITGTLRAMYGKIPFHVGSINPISKKCNLTLQFGPALSYGLYGTKIDTGWYGEVKYFDYLRRFDFGLEGKIGIDYKSQRWTLGVSYGLISPVEDASYHNLAILLGWLSFF